MEETAATNKEARQVQGSDTAETHEQTISSAEDRRRVEEDPDAGAVRDPARACDGAAGQLRAAHREACRDVLVRGLRAEALHERQEIRIGDRLAELHGAASRRARGDRR